MEDFKSHIAKAVTIILTPLVRILIRHGISHSEFSDLTKRVYINVVHQDYSIPNRKTTYARVTTLTGLTRKDIVRISITGEETGNKTKKPLNRATQVLGGWMTDDNYSDKNGQPLELPVKSDEQRSFYDLIDKFSGDVSGRAILEELIRVGAVEKLENGNVKMTKQGYFPQNSQAEQLHIVSTHFSDMLTTGIHNIENEKNLARFQRAVVYQNVPNHTINEFKQYSDEKSQQLLEEYRDWLKQKFKDNKTNKILKADKGRVGIGIYYFNNEKFED